MLLRRSFVSSLCESVFVPSLENPDGKNSTAPLLVRKKREHLKELGVGAEDTPRDENEGLLERRKTGIDCFEQVTALPF